MKKLLLAFSLLLFSNSLFSQKLEEFKYVKDSIITSVIVPMEGQTKEELYSKALNWISSTYKNPGEVIKSKVENDFIRFSGFESINNSLSKYYVEYTMVIYVKDNKYKLDIDNVNYIRQAETIGIHHFPRTEIPIDLNNKSYMINKKGEIKKPYNSLLKNFDTLFNGINKSLYAYMSGTTKKAQDDW